MAWSCSWVESGECAGVEYWLPCGFMMTGVECWLPSGFMVTGALLFLLKAASLTSCTSLTRSADARERVAMPSGAGV